MQAQRSPNPNFFLELAKISDPQGQVLAFQAVFEAQYQPDSPQEEFIIEELAVARQELFEINARRESLISFERLDAARHFDTLRHDQFLKLQRSWRKQPTCFHNSLGQTQHGARLIASIWDQLVRRLEKPDPLLGLEEISQAVQAEGLADDIQNMTPDGWWFLTRYLAMHPNPHEAMKGWVRKSRSKDPIVHLGQAKEQWGQAPDNETSRSDLYQRAKQRLEYWNLQVEQLNKVYQEERDLFCNGFQPDRRITSSLRNLQGFCKFALMKVEHLEKHLQRIQEARRKREKTAQKQPQPRKQATLQPVRQSQAGPVPPWHGPENIRSPHPVRENRNTISEDVLDRQIVMDTLSLRQVMDLELGLEMGEITEILPHEAEQMFTNWPDEEVLDHPEYKRFYEVFGHLSDNSLKQSLLKLMTQEGLRRLEPFEFRSSA